MAALIWSILKVNCRVAKSWYRRCTPQKARFCGATEGTGEKKVDRNLLKTCVTHLLPLCERYTYYCLRPQHNNFQFSKAPKNWYRRCTPQKARFCGATEGTGEKKVDRNELSELHVDRGGSTQHYNFDFQYAEYVWIMWWNCRLLRLNFIIKLRASAAFWKANRNR